MNPEKGWEAAPVRHTANHNDQSCLRGMDQI
jgi:hypothetical protein